MFTHNSSHLYDPCLEQMQNTYCTMLSRGHSEPIGIRLYSMQEGMKISYGFIVCSRYLDVNPIA